MSVILAQITAPHFCAGLVLRGEAGSEIVVEAAPILGYMHGWSRAAVRRYVARKGWAARVVAKDLTPDRVDAGGPAGA